MSSPGAERAQAGTGGKDGGKDGREERVMIGEEGDAQHGDGRPPPRDDGRPPPHDDDGRPPPPRDDDDGRPPPPRDDDGRPPPPRDDDDDWRPPPDDDRPRDGPRRGAGRGGRGPQRGQGSPPRSPRGGRPARSPRNRQRPPPPSDSDQIGPLSDAFLAGEHVNCEDCELLAATVRDLEGRRDQMVLQGSFMDSLKAQRAVEAARNKQLAAVKKRNQNEVQEDLKAKHGEADQNFNEFNEVTKQDEERLEQKLDEHLRATKERHAREIEEHDALWQSEPKQRLFNRSSRSLRIMRTQQQLLMNARRYDEAAQVCQIADREQERETRENHRSLCIAYRESCKLLRKQQDDELDTLTKRWESRRGEFRYKTEVCQRRHVNRANALKFEDDLAKDQDRLWIRGHRNDGDQVTNVMGAHKTAKMSKTANVNDFNTLPLPPLHVSGPGSARRSREGDRLARTT